MDVYCTACEITVDEEKIHAWPADLRLTHRHATDEEEEWISLSQASGEGPSQHFKSIPAGFTALIELLKAQEARRTQKIVDTLNRIESITPDKERKVWKVKKQALKTGQEVSKTHTTPKTARATQTQQKRGYEDSAVAQKRQCI